MTLFELFANEPWLLVGLAFFFSLMIGSFLNVVIYRTPIMMFRDWREQANEILSEIKEQQLPTQSPFNLVVPRSACPNCKKQISGIENIPVISYLFLRGRCRNCKDKISIRYPLVELTTAIMSAVVVWKFGFSWESLAALFFTWVLISLTLIDYDHKLLPDNLTLPLLWAGLLLSLFHGSVPGQQLFIDPKTAIIGAILGYGSLWSVYWAFKLITGKEGMGFGDFKLLAAMGAWLGWQFLPLIVILSAGVGAVVGIFLIATKLQERSEPIPYGPFLAAAGWIALMWGDTIIQSYLQFLGT